MKNDTFFLQAKPVWFPGRERDMNLFAGFRAEIDCPAAGPAVLRVACSSLYRAFVNGRFVAHGPARGPHGFFRVDEIPVALESGRNFVALEVAAYNTPSYYALNVPAFFQAEVVGAGGHILAATQPSGPSTLQPFNPSTLRRAPARLSRPQGAEVQLPTPLHGGLAPLAGINRLADGSRGL